MFYCPYFLQQKPTGSKYICNPPVLDTDEDYICLVHPNDHEESIKWLAEEWDKCVAADGATEYKEENSEGQFTAWRQGVINLIVTSSADFFDKWVEATRRAKEQNLLNKQDRIKLFNKVLYNNEW